MRLSFAFKLIAWALLAYIAFATLSPIELRPVSPLPTQLERALALAVVGFFFALAYPRRIVLIIVLVLGTTILLEVLQLVTPSRHGRSIDLAVKLIGGACGIAIGQIVRRLASQRQD
jgi:VanZ family protein